VEDTVVEKMEGEEKAGGKKKKKNGTKRGKRKSQVAVVEQSKQQEEEVVAAVEVQAAIEDPKLVVAEEGKLYFARLEGISTDPA